MLLARIVVLLVIYLSWRRCAYSWTSCAITRCREIMTPQLSIVKTRFAKASLRPRCARHRSWRATCRLPNGCVGHSASQWLRGSSSFPNRSRGPSSRLRHSDLSPHISVLVAIYTLCWAQSLVTRDFQQGGRVPGNLRTPIQVEISSKEVAIPWETGPWCATLLTLP